MKMCRVKTGANANERADSVGSPVRVTLAVAVKHLNKLPRVVWGHHCWRHLKDLQMWVSGRLESAGLTVINNLSSLYQMK